MAGVEGKVAFITGAGSGIGRATARVLAKGGADVALCDVNLAGAEAAAQEVLALGRKALALRVDVSHLEEVEQAVAQTRNECGRVDILFSNAGIADQVPFTEMTEEQWDRMFNVHLNGTYNCFRAILPGMR
ncbi:MAG: SDR family NAD(P)-dependent oxidoreductase, partial [Candidatus Binatia bacterium]